LLGLVCASQTKFWAFSTTNWYVSSLPSVEALGQRE
jgi:hypothetical protein